MNKTLLATLIASSIALVGCDGDDIKDTANPQASDVASPIVSFNPLSDSPVISTPNDLLMGADNTDMTTYGRLSGIPQSLQDSADIYRSLAQLDGWGVATAFTIAVELPDQKQYNTTLDSSSVEQDGVVLLYKCTKGTSIAGQDCIPSQTLQYGTDYTTQATRDGILVTPLKPLETGTNYFLAVTDKAKDSYGHALTRSSAFDTYSKGTGQGSAPEIGLNALLSGLNSAAAALSGISSEDIVYSATFTTQAVEEVAQAVMDKIVADNGMLTDITNTGITVRAALAAQGVTLEEGSASAIAADNTLIYTAMLDLPYYLPYPSAASCPTGIQLCGNWTNAMNQAPWKGVPTPVEPTQSGFTPNQVAVQITVPNETLMQANGLTEISVTQFVHGITSVKESVYGIAAQMAAQGIATIAIDQPLHGSRSADYLDAQGNPGQDGVYEVTATDTSYGSAYANGNAGVFANLSSLLTTRDNLRQAASDQLALKYAIEKTDLSSVSPLINNNKTSMLGVSLGSIIGTVAQGMSEVYAGSENPFTYTSSVLTVNGQQVAPIMGYSQSFGSLIKSSLTATDGFAASVAGRLGYTAGEVIAFRDSSDAQDQETFEQIVKLSYPQFLYGFASNAQTLLDAGDAIAWAGKTTATPTLVTQIVGNGINLPDQTIPNSTAAEGFPLGGTQGVISTLNLTQVSNDSVSATGQRIYTNYLVGHHSSLLNPNHVSGMTESAEAALRATTEMQTEAISFLKSDGKALQMSAGHTNTIQ